MNKSRPFRLLPGLLVIPVMAFWLALSPQLVQAQESGNPAPSEKFSREELAQMLGPIALYPDKLLSQILMASTYPIEVIEADRWVKKNPGLQGDPLDRALLGKDWDPSVKGICHFPAILALMSERITETTNLGNAFLVQETEVMDMVQELRAKAYAQGNLVTTSQQKVVVERETIIIEPADPRIIYVPYYDPYYIYGPWWYPAYRPYYWGPPGVSLGFGISFWPGIYFGFTFGDWYYFDWPHRYISVHVHERPRFVRHDHWYATPGRWTHAPMHRRGVAYRDKYTATRFGQYPRRHGDYQGDLRGDTRGFPERRDADRQGSRLDDGRTGMGQGRRVDDNSRFERSRQERQRVESELQKQGQHRREPTVSAPQQQPIVGGTPQQQPIVEGTPRQQPVVERGRRQQQAPTGQVFQERARIDRVPQAREAVERRQPQQRRETVFGQGDDGRRERQSSERGRFSRQERSNDSRGNIRGGGGGGGAGGRGDGSRIRR